MRKRSYETLSEQEEGVFWWSSFFGTYNAMIDWLDSLNWVWDMESLLVYSFILRSRSFSFEMSMIYGMIVPLFVWGETELYEVNNEILFDLRALIDKITSIPVMFFHGFYSFEWLVDVIGLLLVIREMGKLDPLPS